MENNELGKLKISWRGVSIGIILTAAALAFIFLRIANPREIWEVLQYYPPIFIILAILAVLVAYGVDALRIWILLTPTGFKIPFVILFFTLIASHFLTLVTPFTAGGFPLVIFILYRHGMSIGQATGVVTGAGLGAQIGLAAIVSLLLTTMNPIPTQLASFFPYLQIIVFLYGLGATIIVILITRARKFKKIFERFTKFPNIATWYGTFVTTIRHLFIKQGHYYFLGILTGALYFSLMYLAGFFILTGFQTNPEFSYATYGLAMLLGISPSFTPIPSGAGVSELFSVYMLEAILPAEELGAFIILWRTIIFYLPVIAGGISFAYIILRWGKKNNA